MNLEKLLKEYTQKDFEEFESTANKLDELQVIVGGICILSVRYLKYWKIT